ncbi:MAG TPA: class D sortase [Trebonia sp.]|nr:class D sortase [Trebonia sp.]
MRRGRHARQRVRRYRRGTRIAAAGTGVLSVCAGTVIAAHIGVFFLHSAAAGGDLVGQERQAIAGAAVSGGPCPAPGGAGPAGLLEAPALSMVAPVLQGTGDAVLNDAVGHDPASVWPGQPGTSVLSAHDVTWFSRIGRLRPGDTVRYVTPCWTYTYTVTSHAVVKAGSPVYSTGAARLVLDTCYPLDALYLTSTRYLVYASLASAAPTHAAAAVPAIARRS